MMPALVLVAAVAVDDLRPVVSPDSRERLAVAAGAAIAADRRIEGMVTASFWFGAEDGRQPDVQRDPPAFAESMVVRLFGSGHAVECRIPLSDVRVIADGRVYTHRISDRETTCERVAEDPGPYALGLLFQSAQYCLVAHEPSLPRAIRECEPVSLADEGTIWTYRCRARATDRADAPTVPPIYEIVVDVGDPPRVLSVAVDVPAEDGAAPPRRIETTALEWQKVGDSTLPRRILQTGRIQNGREIRMLVELDRAAPLPAADTEAPSRPLPAGLAVTDAHHAFRFTVGSPHIVFEGQRLTLDEPLWVHPGERLGELVKSAKPE